MFDNSRDNENPVEGNTMASFASNSAIKNEDVDLD